MRRPIPLVALIAPAVFTGCFAAPIGAEGARVRSGYSGTPLALGELRQPAKHNATRVAQAAEKSPAPAKGARTHTVQPGETLWRIAFTNKIDVQTLAKLNNITDPTRISVGMQLRLPSDDNAPQTLPPAAPSEKSADKPSFAKVMTEISTAPPAKAEPKAGASEESKKAKQRYILSWPVEGKLTSRFGKRWGAGHDGIDIDANRGDPVYAAADGVVLFSDKHGGYGNLVVVRHADNLVTVYAHHDINLVRRGQKVKTGQLLARVGKTGRATGPHLHFEVRRGATPINPLKLLPP